jgi:hypothetical protein
MQRKNLRKSRLKSRNSGSEGGRRRIRSKGCGENGGGVKDVERMEEERCR